jgi:hypothetical protein
MWGKHVRRCKCRYKTPHRLSGEEENRFKLR